MSKQETFFKLKYPTLPNLEQVEEMKNTEFGAFVLYELAAALLPEVSTVSNDDGKTLLERVRDNPFLEMGEFFKDLSEARRDDIGDLKNATLNEFIKLMALADEMENG